MAKHLVETLVDDLDGTEADETVSFGIDGRQFEIDLSAEHASELRELVAPFVRAARRAGGRSAQKSSHPANWNAARKSKKKNAIIRAWAMQNGFSVWERGRLPSAVLTAYENRDNAAADQPESPSAELLTTMNEEKPKRRNRKATIDA